MNTKQWVGGTVAGADFTLYGISNINTLTLAIVDPLVVLVRGDIAGAALVVGLRKFA